MPTTMCIVCKKEIGTLHPETGNLICSDRCKDVWETWKYTMNAVRCPIQMDIKYIPRVKFNIPGGGIPNEESNI